MQAGSFVHLRASSEYSLLYSAARAADLANAARADGMEALGVADRGGLYGPVNVYQTLVAAQVRPVLGAVLGVVKEREAPGAKREAPAFVPIYALGQAGFTALCELSTQAALHDVDGQRVVTWDELFDHAQHLICLTGDAQGPLAQVMSRPDAAQDLAPRMLARLREVFADRLYVELCDQGTRSDRERNRHLFALAKSLRIAPVATSEIRHLHADDVRIVDILHGILHGLSLEEAVSAREPEARYSFVPAQEMMRRFGEYPEALAMTREIADRAHLELPLGNLQMPRFPLPDGVTESDYLRQLAEDGLRMRVPGAAPSYGERLSRELHIIEQMGFAGYFLIVWDFMKFAHDQGISTGPGRGSAAGSLVAYVLAITDVDPIVYDLLFERFLSPERVSWPDIDIDFEAVRRQEVIAYVAARYGHRRVAQIGTLGTFAARAAVRDVGRVLQAPSAQIEALAKSLPSGPGASLAEAVAHDEGVKAVLAQAPGLMRVVEAAQAIEGLPRHASIHAAGVVIATQDLTRWTPLMPGTEETLATQYSMEDVEALGLLKMDFLGLRTLTICDRAHSYVKQTRGMVPIYDEGTLDAATQALLAAGDTDGCFQLEGTGVKHVLQALKPETLEDIIAVISLYRPGPMEQIGAYIAARRGHVKPRYEPPVLKPILEKTYGILIYQEQIMQIAAVMAGFTLGEADVLRRAVAKKKREDLAQARESFVAGCLRMGHASSVANEVYDLIVRFADYGFNRSHAAAYAVLAHRTAFLKANYRAEFMAALIADSVSRPEKVAQYALTCSRAGIAVLGPDVNASDGDCAPEKRPDGRVAIRLGLFAIKHVGVQAVVRLIEERSRGGPFQSLAELCARVDGRSLTKRVLESLIQAGACDGFAASRVHMLAGLEALRKSDGPGKGAAARGRGSERGSLVGTQLALPGLAQTDVERFPDSLAAIRGAASVGSEMSKDDLKQVDLWEKELIGFVVSRQPYAHLQTLRTTLGLAPLDETIARVSTTQEDAGVRSDPAKTHAGQTVRLVGDVAAMRAVQTKKGDTMAFLTLEDETARVEVVLFPKLYANLEPLPTLGDSLVVQARQDTAGNSSWIALRCDRPETLAKATATARSDPSQTRIARDVTAHAQSATSPIPVKRTLYLKIAASLAADRDRLTQLRETLLQHPGSDAVILVYESGQQRALHAVRVCADAALARALLPFVPRESMRIRSSDPVSK